MSDENQIAEVATPTDAATEAELFARVMENSEIVNETVPQPEPVEDEVVEDEEITDEAEDEVEEADEEEADETEEEADEENEEIDLLSEDEVDWDYQVPVTVDGETQHVSLSDLRKGYSTDQSLSAKGRELGEARKALEEEGAAKLEELTNITAATNAVLMKGEDALAKEYHDLKAQLDKMGEDDFDYDKTERQVARKQQAYWNARNEREGMIEAVAKQQQEQNVAEWNEEVKQFHENITTEIPEWNDEYNQEIIKFAIEEVGLDPEFLGTVTDAKLVKAMDDFRKLKQGVSEGAKKRTKAPVKKAPTRKAQSPKQKKTSQEQAVRQRGLSADASAEDQMDFLRQHAAKSLGGE